MKNTMSLVDSVIALHQQYERSIQAGNNYMAIFSLNQLIKDCQTGVEQGVDVKWFLEKWETAKADFQNLMDHIRATKKAQNKVYYWSKEPQLVKAMGDDKVVLFVGHCVNCSRNTYGFFGEINPDPRGLIDVYHTAHDLEANDYGMTGPDIPCCYDCRQTGNKYEQALKRAKKQWTAKI